MTDLRLAAQEAGHKAFLAVPCGLKDAVTAAINAALDVADEIRKPVAEDAVEAALWQWFNCDNWTTRKVKSPWAKDELERMSRAIAGADRARGRSAAEWQRMDSAPTDGKEVDLWVGNRRVTDCHFHCGEWLKWASDSVDDEPHWRRIENAIAWAERPASPPWAETAAPVASAQLSEAIPSAQAAGDAQKTPAAEPRWTEAINHLLRREWARCMNEGRGIDADMTGAYLRSIGDPMFAASPGAVR